VVGVVVAVDVPAPVLVDEVDAAVLELVLEV
jgi:hypothetical protein